MALNYRDSMEALLKYEERFANEIIENEIKILREIKISKEELDDIAKKLSLIFKYNKRPLQDNFPITLSLFIVWSTVYEYSGEMWPNISEKLEAPLGIMDTQFLGDIFLDTLANYNLIQIKEGEGKKYLSPILMHTYISDYYAYGLFDYLNKIYDVVLEGDTSQEAIDNIWGDVFAEDIEFKNIKAEVDLLKSKKEKISREIQEYSDVDDEVKSLKPEDIEKLEIEVDELEELHRKNQEKVQSIDEKIRAYRDVEGQIIELESSFSNTNSKLDKNANEEIVEDIDNLIYEIKNIFQEKNNSLEIQKDELIKENKGLNNKIAVKREKLVSIKTRITTLGGGSLDKGWAEIEEYMKLVEELEILESQIEKKQKYANVFEFEENAGLKQILTASLFNLQKSHPKHFKEFITNTIQMMGEYFLEGEGDNNHPLYEIFIEWNNRIPEGYPQEKPIIVTPPGGKSTTIRRKPLILQSMKKPYIALNTDSFLLNLIIPEQDFTFRQDIDERPYYGLIDKEGAISYIGMDYVYQNQNLYIKEMVIQLESTSYGYLLFQWYNLRESYNISLDEIMVFDEMGRLLNKNKIRNGYYYIVCENGWTIKDATVIDEYQLFNSYRIFEVYLNEEKIELYNESRNKIYSLMATHYEMFKLENYDPIEGVYSDGLPIVTGYMPELLVNQVDIDLDLIYLKIFLNDNLTYSSLLRHSIVECGGGSIASINIYKLLGLRNIATKVKILLVHENNGKILNEEFYFLPKVQFKYVHKGLSVKIQRGMRLSNSNCEQRNMEYIIPLENKDGEEFSIYYNHYGWVKLWVEVPVLDMKIFYGDGKEYSQGDALYGSKRDELKNLFIQWKSNSKRVRSILLFDNQHNFRTRIYMKNREGEASLEPYYDLFNLMGEGQLCYKAEDNNILIEEGIILEIYDKWQIDNIKIYQKEEIDEFILGVEYTENFALNEPIYLEVLNENRTIIKKEVKDQIYIYIKKKDLVSNNIGINIFYYDEYDDILGKVNEKIIAGNTKIKLKSKIDEIDKVLNNGILITGFEYKGETCKMNKPMALEIIEKADSRNFEGEEMYTSKILSNGIIQNVYFYIDTEKKVLPFLIDEDKDGAQYDPKDGQIFWEFSRDVDIKGPLEDIIYVIKEEK